MTFPRIAFWTILAFLVSIGSTVHADSRLVDGLGRHIDVPEENEHVICSGSGCLRLLTYLQAQDMVVGVDDMETRRTRFDARPYAIAHPEYRKLPIFGEFRGHDNPELILTLNPQPHVIFKTYASSMGYNPGELQAKTGIPVVALNYGDLGQLRSELYRSLRLMGRITGKQDRAEKVIAFFEETITDLRRRTKDIPEADRPTVFLGGVAFKGPHGFHSTEPTYPPFQFVNAHNLAHDPDQGTNDLRHSDIAKEKIVAWNPDFLFVDLSTIQLGTGSGGLHELRHDRAYRSLRAVREGRVYGLLPYNWYSKNYGSILANAYFIGKVLYPDRFKDIDPVAKADEIYSFLVGKPVFSSMNDAFQGMAFQKIQGN